MRLFDDENLLVVRFSAQVQFQPLLLLSSRVRGDSLWPTSTLHACLEVDMDLRDMDLQSTVFRLARKLLEMRFHCALQRRRAFDPEFVFAGEAWEYRLAGDLHVYHWNEFKSHYGDSAYHAWNVAAAFGRADGSLWVPESLVQAVRLDL